ncbi:MAG TPA: hypothetical protein VGP02_03575 [Mycobacteriales bacterium]|jgi:hypothetical protein|nr:hypothetical protein [Mycobacteriales bacterium]
MGDKSPHKTVAKKPSKSVKEKRAAKKSKHTTEAQPFIAPRQHT